jgi:phosphate transport system protein
MSTQTSRVQLDQSMQSVRDDILRMGSLVGDQIASSVRALKERSARIANSVIDADARVNELRYKVESDSLALMARQQPAARDLRKIIAAIHIATELERIGDHAVGIANISLRLGDGPLIKPLIDVPRMAEIVTEMINGALDAFVKTDSALAQKVADRDNDVDLLYSQVLRELLTYMVADTTIVNGATYLQWVAHNLERIGDRVTNMCERIIFSDTGELGDYKSFKPRDE